MERDQLPTDKILTPIEILNFYANMFADRIVANLIDLNHYRRVKEINPKFTKATEAGVLTVNQLITLNATNISNSRANFAKVEEFIKKINSGTSFAELYDAEAINITLAPYQLDETGTLQEENKK